MTIECPVQHDDPDVSVVIPTVPSNDHDRVVADLRDQMYGAFEVIVVNDADMGVCEARNRGLRVASAPIVAFTDDDCRPPTDWVQKAVRAFDDDDVVIVEGPTNGGLTYGGTRKYPTCNLAARREVALSVGGFRAEYEYWREDTEFGWRMEDAGAYRYDETIRMCHPDRARSVIDPENEARLRREYPDRYDEIITPDTYLGQINDWLWRRGFWDAVDRIRARR